MSQINAIVLHPSVPEMLLTLLRDYLREHDQPFLVSRSFAQEGNFAILELMKSREDKEPWLVKIPIQYVLFVGELIEGRKNSFGFLLQST